MTHAVTRALCHRLFILVLGLCGALDAAAAEPPAPKFRVVAFYNGNVEEAHASFVREANRWFGETARQDGFSYEATTDWSKLEPGFLSHCQVVLFLDARPEAPAQRAAFREYMEKGGAWMGFHFAGFALTPSEYPQDWDWYHDEFLGSGSYRSNTWRPTSAVLRVEAPSTRRCAACPGRSPPRPTSGTAGRRTCGRTPPSRSCSRSTRPASRWGRGRSRTRSGTRATTRSCGRAATTAWPT